MVREAKHVLKDADCANEVFGFVDAGTGKRFDEPERAHTEGAFAAANTLVLG